MGQLEDQFVIVAGYESSLRDAAVERIKAEGADVTVVEATGEAVRAAAEKAGRLNALVNVLRSSMAWQTIVEADQSALTETLAQVAAFAETMRAAHPWLKKTEGRIANVCSIYGSTGFAGLSENVTADHAIQGLTKAAGVEFARDLIRVNCVVPGALDLPELREFMQRNATEVERRKHSLSLERLGDPVEDFGGALMLLLSDEGRHLVGHPVYADGGQHLSAPLVEPGASYAKLS